MPPRRASAFSVGAFGVLVRMAAGTVVREALLVGALAWGIVALGALGQAIVLSAVVPDLDLLGRMALGALGSAAALAVPVGALGGVVSGARRLSEEGAWLGLRTLGVGGRALAVPVAAFLVVASAAWLGVGHVLEPMARAGIREARVAAAVRVAPVPGRTVRIGGWAAAVEGGRLHFAGNEWIGSAARWRVRPAQSGVVVELEEGELRTADGGTRARFATLAMPVALAGTTGKVHASERTTPDLLRQIAVSAKLGRDAYERWILWKRTLLPLCLVPLGLAVLPAALGRRWPVVAIAGAHAVGAWGVVRIADQWIGTVGPGAAAGITGGAALLWLVLTWGRWRDG